MICDNIYIFVEILTDDMYIIDIKKTEQFDIILVRFPDNEGSAEIRTACNSNYSHAIIHLGNGSFIEGVDPIVSLFSYHRYFFEDLENVKVLRLKEDFKLKLNYVLTETFLRKLAFCNYSKRLLHYMNKRNISNDIIMDFFSQQIWQGGIVCTSLITLPYYIGGLDISKRNEPYYAHFGDIEGFEGFEDVTNIVFKQVDPKEVRKDTFNYLTTYKTGSFLEEQSEIAKNLNQYVQNKYNDILRCPEKYEDIIIVKENLKFSTWEDIFPNIMRWYLSKTGQTIDDELSNLIITKGYHLLWFKEIHKHKAQYFPVYYRLFDYIQREDIEFMINSLQATLDMHEINENNTFENFSKCPCKTFHILLDMYRSFSDLLRSSINQYKALLDIDLTML